MSDPSKCKAKKCKHFTKKPSGFCGWCERKYKSGKMLPDGRLTAEVCKAKNCERPSKQMGWCGICIKKFKKGVLQLNGELTPAAAKAERLRLERSLKRKANREKKELKLLKSEIQKVITIDDLKKLQKDKPEYTKSFGCPYLHIFMDTATCLNRIFLVPKPKKECRKCTYHDSKMPEVKEYLKSSRESDKCMGVN